MLLFKYLNPGGEADQPPFVSKAKKSKNSLVLKIPLKWLFLP
jgi:hypothetical protein